jgi:20S proteasome subunit alpha 3
MIFHRYFFDPKGTLNDLENTNRAIWRSSEAIGIISGDGIILSVTRGKYSASKGNSRITTRIFLLDSHIVCVVSGLIPDANFLINHARIQAQHYKQIFQKIIPIKKILEEICDIKYNFTTRGNARLFGVSFMIAGWNDFNTPIIYKTDPDGRNWSFLGAAIGCDSLINQDSLREVFDRNYNINIVLGIVLNLFSKKYNFYDIAEFLDVAILKKNDENKLFFNLLNKKTMLRFFKFK